MKIIKIKVDWRDGWANDPRLQVLVDKIPNHNVFNYEEKDGFYYAEYKGYVNFFYYMQPDNGYAGKHFNITMKDGSKKILNGPWSSRAGVINNVGFGPCIDVIITDDFKVWKRGYTFYCGSVSVMLVQEFNGIVEIGKGYGLVNKVGIGEIKDKLEFPEGSKFCLKKLNDGHDIVYMPAVMFPNGTCWVKNIDRWKEKRKNKNKKFSGSQSGII